MGIDTRFIQLKTRRTKIVATLGPASRSPQSVRSLIAAGVNVFRINMSHGDHESHRENYATVREAAELAGSPVAILTDLCGPKIRVGKFPGGQIELVDDSAVTVTTRDVVGTPDLIPSQYHELAGDVHPGDRLLLDDGNLELRVEAVEGGEISCRVISGGILKNHKGMNLPGIEVSAPSLTEKDKEDAVFALELGTDFLALSFVRRAEDVGALRTLIGGEGKRALIISKIEKPEALTNIDEILEVSDGIMVARGDLGVELPPQTVPIAQNQLINLARRSCKPVIVATQMLESMISNPRPTRAEVTDVSNAVHTGADAVMLSAESAAGDHPIEAVRMMDLIARQTESYLWEQGAFAALTLQNSGTRPFSTEDAVSACTAQLSRDLMVHASLVISVQGRSASVMSSSRPGAPIFGITADPWVARTMNLLWGLLPIVVEEEELADPVTLVRRIAPANGLAGPGDKVLVVQGFKEDPDANAPSVTIVTV